MILKTVFYFTCVCLKVTVHRAGSLSGNSQHEAAEMDYQVLGAPVAVCFLLIVCAMLNSAQPTDANLQK